MCLLVMLKDNPMKKKSNLYSLKNIKSINKLTMINFFSLKSWFISECGAELLNDESCWLIVDECLFILFKFDIVINDDAVGLFIIFDICDISTDADLFVMEVLKFSLNGVCALAIAVWIILDDDKGVSLLTKLKY